MMTPIKTSSGFNNLGRLTPRFNAMMTFNKVIKNKKIRRALWFRGRTFAWLPGDPGSNPAYCSFVSKKIQNCENVRKAKLQVAVAI